MTDEPVLLARHDGRVLTLLAEARAQTVNLATADVPAAFAAFAARTQPRFTGEWAVR